MLAATEAIIRTTINLDDDLLATAARLTGITDSTALIREGLKAIIARESARRLALLGGSQPDPEVRLADAASQRLVRLRRIELGEIQKWVGAAHRLGVAFGAGTH